jgi:hypothetical protein
MPRAAASPEAVVRTWRSALAPAIDHGEPPSFLLTAQEGAWRRCRAALDLWGGALLVEPVGTGKTWIALGVAAAESGPVLVSGPAILKAQWHAAAERAGVSIRWWSHERWSRGQVPSGSPSLVIVDEAHRFREPTTRRLATLAPWVLGRRTLLLTATPIVNRVADLITLLRLVVPEDALRLDGVGALGMLADLRPPVPALARLVIRTRQRSGDLARCDHALVPDDAEVARGARAVALVRTLTARHPAATGRLLAAVLLDAAASSDLALREALRRYRALLAQARDSGTADRQTLRRFAGVQLDQLVWWELVGVAPGPSTLPIGDLPLVDAILARFLPSDQAWLAGVRAHMRGAMPTICFTRHRATAALLRTALGDDVAWITGDAAGIGPHRIPREAILAAFGPERATWSIRRVPPRILIATDVAAEGLDLQSAGRLVHIDLPWTAVRMAQREGRLLRRGQEHARVAIVVRPAAPPIEAALARMLRISHKQSLGERWLDPLARASDEIDPVPTVTPWAVIDWEGGDEARDVVCLRVHDIASNRTGVIALEHAGGREWRVRHDLEQRLARLHPGTPDTTCVERVAQLVEGATRWVLGEAHRRGDWGPPRLVTRIHRLARLAAWRRDAETVRRLEHLLGWCTSAPRLGDRLCIDRIASASDAELLGHDAPTVQVLGPYEVTPIGVLHFRSTSPALR